jgi:hypothetical protein
MAEPYTYRELRECAEREVKFRRRVYARRVGDRKMSQAKADEEIGKMEQIVKVLTLLEIEHERLL